jgi:hypothetical protein
MHCIAEGITSNILTFMLEYLVWCVTMRLAVTMSGKPKTTVGCFVIVSIGGTLNKLGNTAQPTIACLSQKPCYF